jgi:hypothetical protein
MTPTPKLLRDSEPRSPDRDHTEAAKNGNERLKHLAPARRASSFRLTARREVPPVPCKSSMLRSYKSIVPDASPRSTVSDAIKHSLVSEVAGLVRVEVGNPRLRTNPIFRFPDYVELALLVRFADAGPQPRMVVLLVDLDLALWGQESCPGNPSKIRASASVDLTFAIAWARKWSGSRRLPSPRWSPRPPYLAL